MLRLPRAALFLLLGSACGGAGGGSGPAAGPSASPSERPLARASHVFVVVLENHGFDTVVGRPTMPFLNGLVSRFGLATSYYANVHPSIGDYFMMTTGRLVTGDDAFQGVVPDDNVVRHLRAAGKSWKVYAESIPEVGYLGPDRFPYLKRHNPFAYFSDVVDDPALAARIVPMGQLADDLAARDLPSYGFIVPNAQHDAHNCPPQGGCTDADKLRAADDWMAGTLGPLIASPDFTDSGLLILTFDEADPSDVANGGGRVATVVVSAKTPPGSTSGRFYQHESLLATTLAALDLTDAPGAGATAPLMGDLFPR